MTASFQLPPRLPGKGPKAPGETQTADVFVDRGLTRLVEEAARGDVAAAAVLALSPDGTVSQFKKSLAAISAQERPDGDPVQDIYDLAAEEFAAGRAEAAAGLLASLLFAENLEPDPLVGLAVCALRLGRHDAARLLALESVRRGGKHPRALCVAGLCELEKGEKSVAKDHLALAARLARRNPEFREDLRIAQRLLLTLHYG